MCSLEAMPVCIYTIDRYRQQKPSKLPVCIYTVDIYRQQKASKLRMMLQMCVFGGQDRQTYGNVSHAVIEKALPHSYGHETPAT